MYIFLVRFISEYLIFLLFFSLAYFLLKKDFKLVAKVIIAVSLVYILRKVASFLWYEPRPFVVDPGKMLYPVSKIDSSFFSTHASVAFALAGTIFWRYKKLGYCFLTGAGIVSVGRILAGLHYPWDVAVGGVVGFSISYIVDKLYSNRG